MPVTALITHIISFAHSAFCCSWKQGIFKSNTQKKIDRKKVSSVQNNLIHNLWENQANLNSIDSKHSSSCSFQGHNLHPWVTGFVHAFSFIFFSLGDFFHKFPQLKGDNLYTKIIQKKYRSLCSFKSKRQLFFLTQSIN